jgi:hypothetical protein
MKNPGNYYSAAGYGSIPINTIFRGMNIHLPAILKFTRCQGFDPSPALEKNQLKPKRGAFVEELNIAEGHARSGIYNDPPSRGAVDCKAHHNMSQLWQRNPPDVRISQ